MVKKDDIFTFLCIMIIMSFGVIAAFWSYIWHIYLIFLTCIGVIYIFIYLKEKRKSPHPIKRKKISPERKKEMKKEKMKQIYERGLVQLERQEYREALKSLRATQKFDSIGTIIEFRKDLDLAIKLAETGVNTENIKKINLIIEEGDKKQVIFNEKIDFSALYNSFKHETGKNAIWRREEVKAFKIWKEKRKKSNEFDYQYPLFDYEYALRLANELYDTIEKHQVKSKLFEKINNTIADEIKLIRENAMKLRERKKFGETIEKLTLALQLADKITDLEFKNKLVNEISEDIDQTYILEINSLITKAEKLRKEKFYNKVIVILNEAIPKANKMKISHNKDHKIQEINQYFDSTYNDMINEKIERGNELKKTMNFNESINTYNKAYKIAQKFYSSHKRKNNSILINGFIKSAKMAKIKNVILQLGTQFARLQIIEIAEECGEDEDLIVTTVKNMIEGKEIYAKYFERSRAVAFNLQANIDDIDKLMAIYKQWEKEEKDKV